MIGKLLVGGLGVPTGASDRQCNAVKCHEPLHPVSITRFPLSRLSPGAGLLRNPFVYTINAMTHYLYGDLTTII